MNYNRYIIYPDNEDDIPKNKKVKKYNEISTDSYFPTDYYDYKFINIIKFILPQTEEYHFLKVPLLGQYNNINKKNGFKYPVGTEGFNKGIAWCGRTSSSMVYNWHKLVEDQDPDKKYIRQSNCGDKKGYCDLRYPDGNRAYHKFATKNKNGFEIGYGTCKICSQAVTTNDARDYLGYTTNYLYYISTSPSKSEARNRYDHCLEIIKRSDKVIELYNNIIEQLKLNYPIVIYTGLNFQESNGIYIKGINMHIIVISGYMIYKGELWLLISDPATHGREGLMKLYSDKFENIDKKLTNDITTITIIKGNWTKAQGSLYFLRASHLLNIYPNYLNPNWKYTLYMDHSDAPGGYYYCKEGENGKLPKKMDVPPELLITSFHQKFVYPLQKQIKTLESPVEYFFRSENNEGGYYPAGHNQTFHGGVHLLPTGNTSESAPVRAIAPGYIIAARIDSQNTKYHNKDVKKYLKNYTNFILIRHELDVVDDEGKITDTIPFYSLYMHLLPVNWPDDVSIFNAGFNQNIDNYFKLDWLKKFLLNRYSSIVILDPDDIDGYCNIFSSITDVEGDKWVKCRIFNYMKDNNIIRTKEINQEKELKNGKKRVTAFNKGTSNNLNEAFKALIKGAVVSFGEPYFTVKKGDIIGYINSDGDNSKGFLHWEIFCPYNNGDSGIDKIIKLYKNVIKDNKLNSEIKNKFSKIQEDTVGEDNFLSKNELKRLYENLPEKNKEGFEHINNEFEESFKTDMLKKLRKLYLAFLNKEVSEDELDEAQKKQLSTVSSIYKKIIHEYYKNITTAGLSDNKNKLGYFTFPVSITIKNNPQIQNLAQKNIYYQFQDEKGNTLGDLYKFPASKLTGNKKETIDVPFNTMKIQFYGEDINLEVVSGDGFIKQKIRFFDKMLKYRLRKIQLEHKNEWSKKGIEDLLRKLQDRGFIPIKEKLDDIKEALKPLMWWELDQYSRGNPLGEFYALGDKKSIFNNDKIFPKDCKVHNLHPVAFIWLLNILSQKNVIQIKEDFIKESDAENKPVYYGWVYKDEKARVGDIVDAVVIGEKENSKGLISINMLNANKNSNDTIDLGENKYNDKGIIKKKVNINFWGNWELKIDSKHNAVKKNNFPVKLEIEKPEPISFQFYDPYVKKKDEEAENKSYEYEIKVKFKNYCPDKLEGYIFIQYSLENKNEWKDSKYALNVYGFKNEPVEDNPESVKADESNNEEDNMVFKFNLDELFGKMLADEIKIDEKSKDIYQLKIALQCPNMGINKKDNFADMYGANIDNTNEISINDLKNKDVIKYPENNTFLPITEKIMSNGFIDIRFEIKHGLRFYITAYFTKDIKPGLPGFNMPGFNHSGKYNSVKELTSFYEDDKTKTYENYVVTSLNLKKQIGKKGVEIAAVLLAPDNIPFTVPAFKKSYDFVPELQEINMTITDSPLDKDKKCFHIVCKGHCIPTDDRKKSLDYNFQLYFREIINDNEQIDSKTDLVHAKYLTNVYHLGYASAYCDENGFFISNITIDDKNDLENRIFTNKDSIKFKIKWERFKNGDILGQKVQPIEAVFLVHNGGDVQPL